jgi:hypothetical protein
VGMRIRCPKCQKAFEVPADYAGKRAKCRCGAAFVVPLPVASASRPALVSAPAAVPAPAPAAATPAGSLLDMLDKELVAGLPVASPIYVAEVVPMAAAAPLGPLPSRRPPPAKGFQRFVESPLAICVGLMAMGFALVASLYWSLTRSAGLTALFVVLPLAALALVGAALSGFGFFYPAYRRPGPYGYWVGPWVKPTVKFCSVVGVLLILFPVPFFVAVMCGLRLPEDWRYPAMVFFGAVIPCAIGACIAGICAAFFQSVAMRWGRQFGALAAVSISYLSLLPATVVLSLCVAVGVGSYFVMLGFMGAQVTREPTPKSTLWGRPAESDLLQDRMRQSLMRPSPSSQLPGRGRDALLPPRLRPEDILPPRNPIESPSPLPPEGPGQIPGGPSFPGPPMGPGGPGMSPGGPSFPRPPMGPRGPRGPGQFPGRPSYPGPPTGPGGHNPGSN